METTDINKLPNSFQQTGTPNNTNEKYYNEKSAQEHRDLPERDRVIDTDNLTRDEGTKVNFIPDNENDIYYIPTRHEQQQQQNVPSPSLINTFSNITIEQLKLPLMLMSLYIVFQLPILQNIVKQFFRFSFDEHEQITFSGIFIMGALFSLSYSSIINLIN